MNGFEFPHNDKTFFVFSERKGKTKGLVRDIIREAGLPPNKMDDIIYLMRKGELHMEENGFYIIKGSGFTECGPVSELIVIKVR